MDNKRKNLFLGLTFMLISLGGGQLWAQQEPLNTMYMYNGIAVNPAYTGTRDALSINALHRQQWAGMGAAPTTTNVSLHSPIRFTNMGVGMTVISNQIGPVNDFYANAYYAYRVALKDKLTLSLGLNFGVYNYNAGLNDLSPTESGNNDPILVSENKTAPNGGTGVYLYGENFYLGFAMPKIFQTDLSAYSHDESNLARHYYFSGGYVLHLSDRFALKPSFLTKVVEGAPLALDLNAQLFIDDAVSLGASYRMDNGFALMAGYHIANRLMIGYAYEIVTNDLSNFNNGSHEIVLSYDINLDKPVVKSPRYF